MLVLGFKYVSHYPKRGGLSKAQVTVHETQKGEGGVGEGGTCAQVRLFLED